MRGLPGNIDVQGGYGSGKIAIKGSIGTKGTALQVTSEGPDVAVFGPYIRLPLPSGGPYSLTAKVGTQRNGLKVEVPSLKVGASDLSGEALFRADRSGTPVATVNIDASQDRPGWLARGACACVGGQPGCAAAAAPFPADHATPGKLARPRDDLGDGARRRDDRAFGQDRQRLGDPVLVGEALRLPWRCLGGQRLGGFRPRLRSDGTGRADNAHGHREQGVDGRSRCPAGPRPRPQGCRGRSRPAPARRWPQRGRRAQQRQRRDRVRGRQGRLAGRWPGGLAGRIDATAERRRQRRRLQLPRRALRGERRNRQPATAGVRHAARDMDRRRLCLAAQRRLGVHRRARGARRTGRAARLAAPDQGRHRPAGRRCARTGARQAADRWRGRAQPDRDPEPERAPAQRQCLRRHGAPGRRHAARPACPASDPDQRPRTAQPPRPRARPRRRAAIPSRAA